MGTKGKRKLLTNDRSPAARAAAVWRKDQIALAGSLAEKYGLNGPGGEKGAGKEFAAEGDGRITRDKIGRPTVITNFVLAKLEMAFKCGETDAGAASFAEIGYQTLNRFIKANPDYREMTNDWKNRGIANARITLTNAAATDPFWAHVLLKAKRRKEFGDGHQFGGGGEDPGAFDFIVGVRVKSAPYENLVPGENRIVADVEPTPDGSPAPEYSGDGTHVGGDGQDRTAEPPQVAASDVRGVEGDAGKLRGQAA